MSIIKHVTLQKIVAHDFRYDPCILSELFRCRIIQYAVNRKRCVIVSMHVRLSRSESLSKRSMFQSNGYGLMHLDVWRLSAMRKNIEKVSSYKITFCDMILNGTHFFQVPPTVILCYKTFCDPTLFYERLIFPSVCIVCSLRAASLCGCFRLENKDTDFSSLICFMDNKITR